MSWLVSLIRIENPGTVQGFYSPDWFLPLPGTGIDVEAPDIIACFVKDGVRTWRTRLNLVGAPCHCCDVGPSVEEADCIIYYRVVLNEGKES